MATRPITRRRRTTAAEDAAFMLRRAAESRAAATLAPGDACLDHKNQPTTVERIVDGVAHLANGSVCHVSRLRRAGGAR